MASNPWKVEEKEKLQFELELELPPKSNFGTGIQATFSRTPTSRCELHDMGVGKCCMPFIIVDGK